MIAKKDLKKAAGAVLGEGKMVRKGSSWYLDGPDAIVVINLQKSDYDEKYYVNFGVWLKQLGDEKFPAENHCHIQTRLTALFPDQDETITRGCALAATEAELEGFLELLRDTVIPFCARCVTRAELRGKLEQGVFTNALVMKVARDALGVPTET